MAEQAREYEQDYFRKRGHHSMAQRLSEEPSSRVAEAISPAYHQANLNSSEVSIPREQAPVPQAQGKSNPYPTQLVRQRFSKREKSYLVLIGVCMLILTICNLVIQYKDDKIALVTQEYQAKTSEIQYQTDVLLNELALKYDYQTIKQIAHENGMSLQNSQVRTVGE